MTDRSVSSSLSGTRSTGTAGTTSAVDHRKLREVASIIGGASSSSSSPSEEEESDSSSNDGDSYNNDNDGGLNVIVNTGRSEQEESTTAPGTDVGADQAAVGRYVISGANKYEEGADREVDPSTALESATRTDTCMQSDVDLTSHAISNGIDDSNTASANDIDGDDSLGDADPPTEQQQSFNQSLDEEGIALLSHIFPDTSHEELEAIHVNRLESLNGSSRVSSRVGSFAAHDDGSSDESDEDVDIINRNERPATSRIRTTRSRRRRQRGTPFQLPSDFLTLPPSTSVHILNCRTNQLEWKLISELEAEVYARLGVEGYEFDSDGQYLSAILQRRKDSDGLGMTLKLFDGMVCVHALASSSVEKTRGDAVGNTTSGSAWSGSAYDAGVRVGDEIVGINGMAVPIGAAANAEGALPFVVEVIRKAADPIVLHLHRGHVGGGEGEHMNGSGERSSMQMSKSMTFGEQSYNPEDTTTERLQGNGCNDEERSSDPEIHPLAALLLEKGILQSKDEAILATQQLDEYTERARQWEATSVLCVNASDYSLRVGDVERSGAEKSPAPNGASTPSTPVRRPRRPLSAARGGTTRSFGSPGFASPPPSSSSRNHQTPIQRYPGKPWTSGGGDSFSTPKPSDREARIEMGAVRKGLCVRILNTFVDDQDLTCYTVWVYDCESSTEWYAPVRYLQDFGEMRNQCIQLCPEISEFSFPSKIWLPVLSSQLKEARLEQLERFLRDMCAIIYKLPLRPKLAEVAIYLQSFLGCDAKGLAGDSLILHHQTVSNNCLYSVGILQDGHSEEEREARRNLKNAIQRYVYRIFLLPCIEQVASNFVATVKHEIPSVAEMRDLERKGFGLLKDRASEILGRIQRFITSIQTLIVDGCRNDLISIASHEDYSSLRKRMDSKTGELYSELLFRDSIREHLELEVYIPLRKSISTVLVNAWRHDDMAIQHKMNALSMRPQSYFNLAHENPTGYSSVIAILKEGVGRSSLPCMKMRAIVDASKGLLRTNKNATVDDLGADEFLPALVYCVVMSRIERPCALCELLQELADERSMLGEVGYYFSSFQAAITHIQEFPLTEW